MEYVVALKKRPAYQSSNHRKNIPNFHKIGEYFFLPDKISKKQALA
jgi:hypothetical protein